ncbi:MAG: hypothetical protein ACRC62_36585 [Microcoleus sp.]
MVQTQAWFPHSELFGSQSFVKSWIRSRANLYIKKGKNYQKVLPVITNYQLPIK